jgi:hypothetical protein
MSPRTLVGGNPAKVIKENVAWSKGDHRWKMDKGVRLFCPLSLWELGKKVDKQA